MSPHYATTPLEENDAHKSIWQVSVLGIEIAHENNVCGVRANSLPLSANKWTSGLRAPLNCHLINVF
jgi:hypothetical protein